MKEQMATVVEEARVLDANQNAETEEVLEKEVSEVEAAAGSIVIANQADYESAGEFLKTVKGTLKKVKDYWEPLRVSAKATYDDVLAKKKEMTDPLQNAEKILKGKISDYLVEEERKRREQEEALKRLAQAEVDKKLEEAAQLQEQGDKEGAEFAMAEAEVLDDASLTAAIAPQTQKVSGVSTRKDWKIKSIDASKVPIDIAGIVLRPVDEGAVLRLIKSSKGTVNIPGVEYVETVSVSARSK